MRQHRNCSYSYLVSYFFNGEVDNLVLTTEYPIDHKNVWKYEDEIESRLLCQDGYPKSLRGSLKVIAVSSLA